MGRHKCKTELSYSKGILTARLSGIFDQRSADCYRKDLFSAISELQGKKFALLADISDVEGATPEAFDIVKRIINRLPEFGLVAKAYVYKGPVIKGMMFHRIPELEQLEYSFFTDIEVASDWLTKEYQRHISSHS